MAADSLTFITSSYPNAVVLDGNEFGFGGVVLQGEKRLRDALMEGLKKSNRLPADIVCIDQPHLQQLLIGKLEPWKQGDKQQMMSAKAGLIRIMVGSQKSSQYQSLLQEAFDPRNDVTRLLEEVTPGPIKAKVTDAAKLLTEAQEALLKQVMEISPEINITTEKSVALH